MKKDRDTQRENMHVCVYVCVCSYSSAIFISKQTGQISPQNSNKHTDSCRFACKPCCANSAPGYLLNTVCKDMERM